MPEKLQFEKQLPPKLTFIKSALLSRGIRCKGPSWRREEDGMGLLIKRLPGREDTATEKMKDHW